MVKKGKWERAGELSVAAGLFIGIGVGMLKGITGTGAVIGLGVGFVVALIFHLFKKK